jgi:hypothetical protein
MASKDTATRRVLGRARNDLRRLFYYLGSRRQGAGERFALVATKPLSPGSKATYLDDALTRPTPLPLAALCVLSVPVTGCWFLFPASATEDATNRERLVCSASAPAYPPDLFSPRMVVSVTPLYFTRSVRGNQESHLQGASLVLKPFLGLSAQDLERLLNCHAARSQLKRDGEPVVANDPYWAPGHVTRVSVGFEEGVTTVQIEGQNFEAAKAILDRANAFVRSAG